MYHHISGRKLGMTTDHKEAMLKNMVTSLISEERITTTVTRAKELRILADKMITLGKKGDLSAIRLAGKTVKTKDALTKLFNDLAKRFAARSGGYTRLIKTENRKGDHAPMAIMEWVEKGAALAPPKIEEKSKKASTPKTKEKVPKAEKQAKTLRPVKSIKETKAPKKVAVRSQSKNKEV